MDISVCICTYRRPMVADCIESILVQEGVDPSSLEIVVADDDPERSACSIVQAAAEKAKIAIRYVCAGSRNVAACRNACLDAARHDWIAFIDDDEIAERDWLAELIRARTEFDCEVVKGYVRAKYPPMTPGWVLAGDPFTRDYGPTGRRLPTCAAGNVLFSRRFATEKKLRFDPALGRSGGEDVVFFDAMARAGARIVSCASAIVNEIVPLDRTASAYLRRRFMQSGSIHRQRVVGRQPALARFALGLKSYLFVVVCAAHPLVSPMLPGPGFRMFQRFWTHVGIIRAMLGAGDGAF